MTNELKEEPSQLSSWIGLVSTLLLNLPCAIISNQNANQLFFVLNNYSLLAFNWAQCAQRTPYSPSISSQFATGIRSLEPFQQKHQQQETFLEKHYKTCIFLQCGILSHPPKDWLQYHCFCHFQLHQTHWTLEWPLLQQLLQEETQVQGCLAQIGRFWQKWAQIISPKLYSEAWKASSVQSILC